MALVAGVASTCPAAFATDSQITDLGTARALAEPVVWLMDSGPAVIWQSDNSSPGLTFQPLDRAWPVVILPYADFAPQRWQVVPAHDDTFHIVWLERDGRLRSALIQADGQTARGPVELSTAAGSTFAIVQQADGATVVIWTAAQTNQLVATRLDASGRPGSIQVFPSVQGVHLAAARDQQDTIFVAWLTSTEPRSWAVTLATLDANLTLTTPQTIGTLVLSPEEVVSTVQLGLTLTHIIVVSGLTHAQQPDSERVVLVSTSISAPQPGDLTELRLPAGCPVSDDAPNASVGSTTSRAELRWPRVVSGQGESLPLALACRTDDGWRPVIVTIIDAASATWEQAASIPLDVAPPAITVTADGQITLAWAGLDGAIPHLYATTLAPTTPPNPTLDHPSGLTALLRGLTAGLALGWMWLILPTILLWRFAYIFWTWPMALAVFGAVQLLWPGSLFDRLPTVLTAAGLDRWTAGHAVGATLMAIALIAGLLMFLAHRLKSPVWVQWLTFGLADTLLVWAIFGSNVM